MNKHSQNTTRAAQSGGFPFRALPERWARAIDDSLALGLDFADPFAPGWADTDHEFFGNPSLEESTV